jgi:hypothetical protein
VTIINWPSLRYEANARLFAAVFQIMPPKLVTDLRDTQTNPKPEFFRLPKPSQRDPYFGLARTTYYELEKIGAIRLTRLRKRGNTRGTTLIPFDQVLAYLRGLTVEGK